MGKDIFDMKSKVEIKRISKNELWVKNNQCLLTENNTIYIVAVGEQSTEIAKAHNKLSKELAHKIDGRINYLINLNKAGKSSREARRMWKKLSEHEKTRKVALFGVHPVAKILASFVIGVTLKKEMKFFHTKEEALDWL